MILTKETINFINFIISGYVGYAIAITGLIGNMINILVFTQLKLFRRNQSAFYLTVTAIIESFQLAFGAVTRATATIFIYDLSRTSHIWCKLRIYLLQFLSTTSAMTISFAAIDQYLSTSYNIRLRQISTFKLAQRLITILVILASLYNIPVLIFQEIRPDNGCAIYNSSYNYFYSFVHLCIIVGLLPIVVSSLFSVFSFRNVRRIVRRQIPVDRRRLDRQLTAMILVRVVLFVITTLPYVTDRIYESNYPVDSKDVQAVAVNQLIRTTATAIFNTNFAGSFYIFLASSSRFRRQVKHLFSKKLWRTCFMKKMNRNQIGTEMQAQQTNELPASNIELDC